MFFRRFDVFRVRRASGVLEFVGELDVRPLGLMVCLDYKIYVFHRSYLPLLQAKGMAHLYLKHLRYSVYQGKLSSLSKLLFCQHVQLHIVKLKF